MGNMELIIWDWNGTLLNDVDACVKAMNIMLKCRNMVVLYPHQYKEIFTFPVQDYYQILGFNFEKEPFEDLSIEYISLYKELSKESQLHNSAIEVLNEFRINGIEQVILSASEQGALEDQVNQHKISNYFQSLIGLNNIHAKSKLQNALNYINESKVSLLKTCLIGDTYHDYEVARSIGCKCILINNGHQNLNKYSYHDENLLVNNLENVLDLHILV